ncbi:MAG: hypothetical protein EOO43_01215 [Flavobacterium sp.]|nr:MAG: hypothetical protein EOO43_01215 [Flavobacterium sp.]
MIPSKKPFSRGGLARLKIFLPEFCRGFIFNMLSENDLEGSVMRVQTDGICFSNAIDFKSLGLTYYPSQEDKSTGRLKFYNVNCYMHVCECCGCEYKYDKKHPHSCE